MDNQVDNKENLEPEVQAGDQKNPKTYTIEGKRN
jgi:hypothetical protein